MSNVYMQRAEAWGLQTSTIGGIAAIATAAVGGGADALGTGGVVAVTLGLAIGGLTAIFLPGKDAAPMIAGADEILSAIASHQTAIVKAEASTTAAAQVLVATAPKIAAQVDQVASQVQSLSPIVAAAASVSGKPGVAAVIGDAGTIVSALETGLGTADKPSSN